MSRLVLFRNTACSAALCLSLSWVGGAYAQPAPASPAPAQPPEPQAAPEPEAPAAEQPATPPASEPSAPQAAETEETTPETTAELSAEPKPLDTSEVDPSPESPEPNSVNVAPDEPLPDAAEPVDEASEDEAEEGEDTEEPRPALAPDPIPFRARVPIDYSLPNPNPKLKNYIWPAVGTLGINMSMWGFSKITGAEFAHITPEHWRQNFITGFQWDDNEFEVNQFGHPYQGGMYYATARVNGLSFWQSVPYVMFGSWQWEYFMETESPSTNDFMTTTWGGVFMGEVLYRLSMRMLDDSTSGSERFWREFAALAISPISGLDRLIMGKAWKAGPPGKKFPLEANLRVGIDGVGLSEGTGWGNTFRARIRFDYGDPYAKKKLTVPFEVFDFAAQLNFGQDILGQAFDGTGVLLGARQTGVSQKHLHAWIWDFEYFTNATTQMFERNSDGVYQLGEMGTGYGWYGEFDLGRGFSIDTRADAIYVPTGAITSPWAKYEANRSYNYAMGAASKLEFNFRHQRWGRLYARTNRYFYFVVDGAKGEEFLGLLQLGGYLNIYGGHGIGASAIRYDRNSYYRDYESVEDYFWTGQLQYELEY